MIMVMIRRWIAMMFMDRSCIVGQPWRRVRRRIISWLDGMRCRYTDHITMGVSPNRNSLIAQIEQLGLLVDDPFWWVAVAPMVEGTEVMEFLLVEH